MENRINERIKTAKRRKMVHLSPENTSARELKRLNQLNTTGSWIDNLTDFHLNDLEEILIEDGLVTEIVKLIGQGKEANVYWVRDSRGRDMAMKLFRMHTTSHRSAFSDVGDTGKLQVVEHFALKEYLNLSYAQEAGARVPKRGEREEFIFFMDFLGDETGQAPLLRNVDLKELGTDPVSILEDSLDQLELMFNTGKLVHGDFSEHNLVWYRDRIWVIDFFQSQRWHPKFRTNKRIRKQKAVDILRRDAENILNHFMRKYKTSFYLQEVMDVLVHEKVEDWAPLGLMSEYYDPKGPKKNRRR